MNGTREKVLALVMKGIETDDYNFVRQASALCSDETGVFFAESDTFVMIDDEIVYFNGAFGTTPND